MSSMLPNSSFLLSHVDIHWGQLKHISESNPLSKPQSPVLVPQENSDKDPILITVRSTKPDCCIVWLSNEEEKFG